VVSRRIKHDLYKDNSLKSMMSMICIMHGYNHVDLIPMMIWRGLYDFNTCRPHLEWFLLRSTWRSSNFVTDVFQLWNALTFGWLVGLLLRWERHEFYTFINKEEEEGGEATPWLPWSRSVQALVVYFSIEIQSLHHLKRKRYPKAYQFEEIRITSSQ